ncbi:hypothetical protein BDZ88DRAFT_471006 [Geranomyces variabilis]|nr:hypothetical protein BDZ88DRAFT_471006 [Geranomyces variabilis]
MPINRNSDMVAAAIPDTDTLSIFIVDKLVTRTRATCMAVQAEVSFVLMPPPAASMATVTPADMPTALMKSNVVIGSQRQQQQQQPQSLLQQSMKFAAILCLSTVLALTVSATSSDDDVNWKVCKTDPPKCFQLCVSNPQACATALSGPLSKYVEQSYIDYVEKMTYEKAIALGKSKKSATANAKWVAKNAKANAKLFSKISAGFILEFWLTFYTTRDVVYSAFVTSCTNGAGLTAAAVCTAFTGPMGIWCSSAAMFAKKTCDLLYQSSGGWFLGASSWIASWWNGNRSATGHLLTLRTS